MLDCLIACDFFRNFRRNHNINDPNMSDAQVPTSPIISKNQKMMECPATVQSLVPLVHPLEAGPALVSPDITTTKFAPTTSPSTTLSTASNQQQPTGVSSSNLSAHEGLIISGIQMLAPRTGRCFCALQY